MKRGPFFLWVSSGIVIVALSLTGFINLGSRPGLPKPYAPGAVDRVDSRKIHDIRDLDYIFSTKKIGDPIEIELKAAGVTKVVRVALGRYYPQLPWIFLVIGGSAFLIGFAVFWLKPEDRRARIFYCATQAFGSAVLVSGDVYGLRGGILPYAPGVLFNFAYPLAPALLWRFCRTFSARREKGWLYAFWGVPIAFGAVLNAGFLISQLKPSIAVYQAVQDWLFVFRAYVMLAIVAAVVELIRSFRQSNSEEVRAQIKWVFFGMIAGLAPFVFLYQLPITVLGNGREILSEDVSIVFTLLVPLTLAVAIVKHRLLNINVVINRSLVYSLLTIVMVGFYLLAVEGLGAVFARTARLHQSWIPVAAAILVALAFQPGRKRIQIFIDKTFFRQGYDYRHAVLGFIPRAEKMMSPDDLVAEFSGAVSKALPVEKIGIVVSETEGDGPQIFLRAGLDEDAARSLLSCPAPAGDAWAREESVRTAQSLDFSGRDMLRSLNWEVVLSLPFESGPLAGFAALGRKKSGQRFTGEDIDLVRTLAGELVLGLRRIRLQEEVVYERASREKADELSRLKTEFISSVSHELRTPMSSLQGLSELLGSGKVVDEARRARLLQLMAGECGRLSRFLHNVLDFGKIEREAKLYDIRPAALQPLIREVIELSRPDIPEGDLCLRAEMPDEPVVIEADQDAVRQALLNLVDNATKYCEGRKEVTVRLVPAGESVEIQVEDKGIGIDPADSERIFEAFFRSPQAARQNPKGVGLGLNIVKHIMDAHGGRVGLKSEPGKGSTFSLIFPRRRSS